MTLYIKLGIAIAVFLFGVAVGCSAQSKRDKGKLEAADRALNIEREQVAILSATLVGIDEEAAAQVDAANAQAKHGEVLVKESGKAEIVYREKLVFADRLLEQASKVPQCKAQLEQVACVEFQ